jgi:hypothetical protein
MKDMFNWTRKTKKKTVAEIMSSKIGHRASGNPPGRVPLFLSLPISICHPSLYPFALANDANHECPVQSWAKRYARFLGSVSSSRCARFDGSPLVIPRNTCHFQLIAIRFTIFPSFFPCWLFFTSRQGGGIRGLAQG